MQLHKRGGEGRREREGKGGKESFLLRTSPHSPTPVPCKQLDMLMKQGAQPAVCCSVIPHVNTNTAVFDVHTSPHFLTPPPSRTSKQLDTLMDKVHGLQDKVQAAGAASKQASAAHSRLDSTETSLTELTARLKDSERKADKVWGGKGKGRSGG